MHKYLTGKRVIPVTVLLDVCDFIGIRPEIAIAKAYQHLVEELGPPTKLGDTF